MLLKFLKKTSIFFIVNTCILGFANANPSTSQVEKSYSSINQRGNIVNKKERIVFPLGIYSTFTDKKDLKMIKSLGLNTILNYNYGYKNDVNEFIKDAQDNDLYVILSLKDFYSGLKWTPKDFDDNYLDRYLRNLQHKENIIGFNINDELPSKYSSKIHNNYLKIRKNGYSQPIIQVFSEKQENQLSIAKNSADILSIDSYPVGLRKNLSSVSEYVNKVKTKKPSSTWAIIQIMSWSLYKKDLPYHLPTTEEIKNQAFQAIISGANGILFYSYNDLFHNEYGRAQASKELAMKNISNLESAIPEIKKLIRVSLSEKNDKTYMSTNGFIVYKYYSTKNEKWLAIVNTSYNQVEIKNSKLHKQLSNHINVSSDSETIYIPALYSELINISN
ncbi:beta-galactosidase [Serratia fonticola]|uniref:beta-galactosidase n=1 Tax=Serratia fonticola TaxID=47917 RepID=UPI002176FBB6|nr:beta-galactosidase [Serratia fonticola]CAI1714174.1 Uncharacterised protein [Serratia fonticola]